MDTQTLWHLERRFWLDGAPFYEDHLSPDCVMVVPASAGILERAAILAGVAHAPRWVEVEMTVQRHLRLSDAATLLVYKAAARREAAGSDYRALVSSVYRIHGSKALLAFHQQTPLGP